MISNFFYRLTRQLLLFVCFQIRSFQLENSLNCNKDFVEIREGNATGHLVGRYCGNSLPGNYSSIQGHTLWVRFVSDGSGSAMGFQARFNHSKLICFRNGFQKVSYKLGMMNIFSNVSTKNNPTCHVLSSDCRVIDQKISVIYGWLTNR